MYKTEKEMKQVMEQAIDFGDNWFAQAIEEELMEMWLEQEQKAIAETGYPLQ